MVFGYRPDAKICSEIKYQLFNRNRPATTGKAEGLTAMPVQGDFGARISKAAAVIASVPKVTDSRGAILKKGEWWDGTCGPPLAAASKSACGVPPTVK